VRLSTEHRELVPKDDDLELLEVLGAGTKQDEPQQAADKQVAERAEQKTTPRSQRDGRTNLRLTARSRAGTELKHPTRALWAYRYRVGGRGSRRVQRGGFASERDAREALERALETLRRANCTASTLTLAEFVDEYLAQHDAQPETIEKLRWLLTKAVLVFGDRRLGQLRPQEIAVWRMTIPPGHRFEATQALRQVLTRAMHWGMIDINPATHGVDNPQRRRTEKRPFESWAQLAEVASALGDRYGPLVCSRPRRDSGQASGSRSSGATSTWRLGSSMSGAHSGTAG
jgi:hypothetical protein